MLGKSDRLRILCYVLNIGEEELLRRYSEEKQETAKQNREPVHLWWNHRHQPTKSPQTIIAALQHKAVERSIPLDIAKLWDAPISPREFTQAVGTTVYDVSAVLSAICRRSIFEETDRLPFLRLMREEREQRADFATPRGRMHGSYYLYRTHSLEPALCRESFTIDARPSELVASGHYRQYAGDGRERPIDLSMLVTDGWLHAIGAYRETQQDVPAISMVHGTILCSAVRDNVFAGILHDVMDNRTGLAGQRILLEKASDEILPGSKPVIFKRDEVSDPVLVRYREFLRDEDREDPYLLMVDVIRLNRILGAP